VKRIAQILVILFFSTFAAAATGSPFDQAQKHMGETQCVTGKVVRVEAGSGGVHPPLSKNFDVEQREHFSAGQFRAPHSRSARKKKGHPTIPAEIPEDVESD